MVGFSDSISQKKHYIKDHALTTETILELRNMASKLKSRDEFSLAKIGRLDSLQRDKNVRGDEVSWITDWSLSPLKEVSCLFEAIVEKSKYELFQSTKRFESHFSRYPPGTFYERHRDQHSEQKCRILSAVLYIGPWQEGDGGELYLYPNDSNEIKVSPLPGRLAVFRSEVEHEVKTTQTDRWSVTAWIRNDEFSVVPLRI